MTPDPAARGLVGRRRAGPRGKGRGGAAVVGSGCRSRCRGTRCGGGVKVSEPSERAARTASLGRRPRRWAPGPSRPSPSELGRCVPAGPLGPPRAEQQGYRRLGRRLVSTPPLTPSWRGMPASGRACAGEHSVCTAGQEAGSRVCAEQQGEPMCRDLLWTVWCSRRKEPKQMRWERRSSWQSNCSCWQSQNQPWIRQECSSFVSSSWSSVSREQAGATV